jgi:hypothetical protein
MPFGSVACLMSSGPVHCAPGSKQRIDCQVEHSAHGSLLERTMEACKTENRKPGVEMQEPCCRVTMHTNRPSAAINAAVSCRIRITRTERAYPIWGGIWSSVPATTWQRQDALLQVPRARISHITPTRMNLYKCGVSGLGRFVHVE